MSTVFPPNDCFDQFDFPYRNNFLSYSFVCQFQRLQEGENDIMENELNYLRSEIAKIRMEKAKAKIIKTG